MVATTEDTVHVVKFSGGEGSAETAYRVAERFGILYLFLLFTDTESEDNDLYRFMIQVAGDIFGVPLETVATLSVLALAVPEVRGRTAPEREVEWRARRAALAQLRAATAEEIPRLIWIAEGRNPWEAFRDRRFIGNSRLAHCTYLLKQEPADEYIMANFDPARTVVYVGIDWSEEHRFTRMAPAFKAMTGFDVAAPLCEPPLPSLDRREIRQRLRLRGIRRARMYLQGFPHNNCGAKCVRGGKGYWLHTLRVRPDDYMVAEDEERELRKVVLAHHGDNRTILTETVDGEERGITLEDLRVRFEAGHRTQRSRKGRDTQSLDAFDIGGCGCGVSDYPPAGVDEGGAW